MFFSLRHYALFSCLIVSITVHAEGWGGSDLKDDRSANCSNFLQLGYKRPPDYLVSESRSGWLPRLSKSKSVLWSQDLSDQKIRTQFLQTLAPEERAKIFYYLVDHKDMFMGKLLFELDGYFYRRRHALQKDDDLIIESLSLNLNWLLSQQAKAAVSIVRELANPNSEKSSLKFRATDSIPISIKRDAARRSFDRDDYFNHKEVNAEYVLPLKPGALDFYLKKDRWWTKYSAKMHRLESASISLNYLRLRLPHMHEFMEWLYERPERVLFAEHITATAIKGMGRILSMNTFTRGSLERTQSPALQAMKAIMMNKKISNEVVITAAASKRNFRSKINKLFQQLYDTKIEIGNAYGAFDKKETYKDVLDEMKAHYTAMDRSAFETEAQYLINKIEQELTVLSSEGIRISTTNLESLLVGTNVEVQDVVRKITDFKDRVLVLKSQVTVQKLIESKDGQRALLKQKAEAITGLEALDEDIQSIEFTIKNISLIVEQALQVYDRNQSNMSTIQKSKADHVRQLYQLFRQNMRDQLNMIGSLQRETTKVTQTIDKELMTL